MIRYVTPLASLVLGLLIFFFTNWTFRDFDTNDLGLGQNTTSHIAKTNEVVLFAGNPGSIIKNI